MSRKANKKTRIYARGILSSIYGFLKGPRKHAPPKIRKFLDENKNKRIISMDVAITPIQKPLPKVLNFLTGGYYEKKRREAGYNDINHAYMVITLEDGQQYKLEKNHVVEVSKYKPNTDKKIEVKLDRPLDINTFLNKAERYQETQKGRDNFWTYDPTNNNCQYFVDDIVKGNKEDIVNDKEVNDFSFQSKAHETIEPIKNTARLVTDIAGAADRAIHGEGMKKKRKRIQYRKHKIY